MLDLIIALLNIDSLFHFSEAFLMDTMKSLSVRNIGIVLATVAWSSTAVGIQISEQQTQKETATSNENQRAVDKRTPTKLEDGVIVLFPDLAKSTRDFGTTLKSIEELLNEIEPAKQNELTDGTQFIRIEQLRDAVNSAKSIVTIFKKGQWDLPNLLEFQDSIDRLHQSAVQVRLPKVNAINTLKARLTVAYQVEKVFTQRVNIGFIQPGALNKVNAKRYQCELDLAEGVQRSEMEKVVTGQNNNGAKPVATASDSNAKQVTPSAVKIVRKTSAPIGNTAELSDSYTIYPDLISVEPKLPLKKHSPLIFGMQWEPPAIDAKNGLAFITRELLKNQFQVMQLCSMVAESGAWDSNALNDWLHQISETELIIRKLSKTDRIKLLKELLSFSYHIEIIACDRVSIGNLRPQYFYQARSTRYAMELALYQTESNP